jgi:hypothetical protein
MKKKLSPAIGHALIGAGLTALISIPCAVLGAFRDIAWPALSASLTALAIAAA